MSLSDSHFHALLVACSETHVDELDCDEFLDAVATYAELRAEQLDVPTSYRKVEEHARLCANCRQECEALLEVLRATVTHD